MPRKRKSTKKQNRTTRSSLSKRNEEINKEMPLTPSKSELESIIPQKNRKSEVSLVSKVFCDNEVSMLSTHSPVLSEFVDDETSLCNAVIVSSPQINQYQRQNSDDSTLESPKRKKRQKKNKVEVILRVPEDDIFNDTDESIILPTHSSVLSEFMDDEACMDNAEIVSSLSDSRIDFCFNEAEISPNKLRIKKKRKKKTFVEEILQEDPEMNIFNKAQYNKTDDGTIVIIPENESITFHGLLSLSVLHGEVEIMGYCLNKNHQDFKIYSLRGSSLLTIKNCTQTNCNLKNFLHNLNLHNVQLSNKSAILLCKKLEDRRISFIEKHMSQQILPKGDSLNSPRAVFEPKGPWNVLKINQEWNEIIDRIDISTKMMFCGGKGVGKSTLLRYTINRLLVSHEKVIVVDLDPGQSEFTVPGCISIVTVDQPLFGLNYSHLQKTCRSVLSNINIGFEPDKYVRSVQYLLNYEIGEGPVLINYMGYTHGVGINILSAVIVAVQPTDVLQINSNNPKRNYSFDLVAEKVLGNSGFLRSCIQNFSSVEYILHKVQSVCDDNDGWTAEPRQLREMCVLSYFGQIMDSNSVFGTNVPMFEISLSSISITDLNGEVIDPAAINANLVALCSLSEKNSLFLCFGYGIVRGIDLTSDKLVLITPEDEATLEKVSHLVLGSVLLPPSIYMTPDEVMGEMPYVNEGGLVSLGQIPKRSHIRAKN